MAMINKSEKGMKTRNQKELENYKLYCIATEGLSLEKPRDQEIIC